jgi:predicted nucleic acid-binding protein
VPPTIALLDANILYAAHLRSLLLYIGIAGLFQARWSNQIQEEWLSNLLRNRPDLTAAQLERTRQLMDKAIPEAVVTGYENLIPSLSLPDEADRHVLAAAIQSGANIIVTRNLVDFPAEALHRFHIRALNPDDFVMQFLRTAPVRVKQAAETHRLSLINPPLTGGQYRERLAAEGLSKTAATLRELDLQP